MKVTQSIAIVAIVTGMAAIIAKLRVFAKRRIPVGYEDESGFHLGVER